MPFSTSAPATPRKPPRNHRFYKTLGSGQSPLSSESGPIEAGRLPRRVPGIPCLRSLRRAAPLKHRACCSAHYRSRWSPLSSESGPIEANVKDNWLARLVRSPLSSESGPIEASAMYCTANSGLGGLRSLRRAAPLKPCSRGGSRLGSMTSPLSSESGPIEATPASRKSRQYTLVSALFGERPH